MKRLMLGSVVALLLMGGQAGATCLYQGFPYSEGARICIHRTMFMCRGRRWVRTAERCWERYSSPQGAEDFLCMRSSPTRPESNRLERILPASR
jgi:hypothetical protein